MRRFRAVPALVALVLLTPLTGCVDRDAQAQAKRTEEFIKDPRIAVSVVAAETRDVAELVEVTGSIRAADQAGIGAVNPGRIVAVYVRDGDAVRAGQAIAQQDTADALTRVRQAQAGVDVARSGLQQAQADAQEGPSRSAAAVGASQALLAQARSQLEKARNGARPEEVAQVEAQVAAARSNLETAKSGLARAQRLFGEGAISKSDLEQAQNAHQSAVSAHASAQEQLKIVRDATRPEDVRALEAQVRAAEEALRIDKANQRLDVTFRQRVDAARANLTSAQEQARLAQRALSDATIRSSFSGRISGRPLQAGTFVGPGTVVANVVGTEGAYFEADVPEGLAPRLEPGMAVQVSLDALPGVTIRGSVVAVNPQASDVARLFAVRIQLTERLGDVKSGMFARGQIKLGVSRGAVLVPREAIVRDGESARVFVVEAGKARRVEVQLGLRDGAKVQIRGLEPGAQVVVRGHDDLRDGAEVTIVAPPSVGPPGGKE